jgi:hypothetical protein
MAIALPRGVRFKKFFILFVGHLGSKWLSYHSKVEEMYGIFTQTTFLFKGKKPP